MQDDPCTFHWQAELANGRTGSASRRAFREASGLGQVPAQAAVRRSFARGIPGSAAVARCRTNPVRATTGVRSAIRPGVPRVAPAVFKVRGCTHSHWVAPLHRRAPPRLFRDTGEAARPPPSARLAIQDLQHKVGSSRWGRARAWCAGRGCGTRLIHCNGQTGRRLRRKYDSALIRKAKTRRAIVWEAGTFWPPTRARPTPRGRCVMGHILIVDDDLHARLAMPQRSQ